METPTSNKISKTPDTKASSSKVEEELRQLREEYALRLLKLHAMSAKKIRHVDKKKRDYGARAHSVNSDSEGVQKRSSFLVDEAAVQPKEEHVIALVQDSIVPDAKNASAVVLESSVNSSQDVVSNAFSTNTMESELTLNSELGIKRATSKQVVSWSDCQSGTSRSVGNEDVASGPSHDGIVEMTENQSMEVASDPRDKRNLTERSSNDPESNSMKIILGTNRDVVLVEDTVASQSPRLATSRSQSQDSCVPETQLTESRPTSENSAGYVGGSERSQSSSFEARIVRRARPSRACKRRSRTTTTTTTTKKTRISTPVFPELPILAIQSRMNHFDLPDDDYAVLKLEKMISTNYSSQSTSDSEKNYSFDHRIKLQLGDILSAAFCPTLTGSSSVFVIVSIGKVKILKFENSKWTSSEIENEHNVRKVVAIPSSTIPSFMTLCDERKKVSLREVTVEGMELKFGISVNELGSDAIDGMNVAAVSERRLLVSVDQKLFGFSKKIDLWTDDSESSVGSTECLLKIRNYENVVATFGEHHVLRLIDAKTLKIVKKFKLDFEVRQLYDVEYDDGILFLTLVNDDKLHLVAFNCSNHKDNLLLEYDVTYDFDDVIVLPKYLALVSGEDFRLVDRFNGRDIV